MWQWLTQTDAGLLTRVILGVVAFATFAITDLRQRGHDATRWREYGVLLIAVAAAMAYGMINDQVTSRISWEYFYYGKGLDRVLGPTTPPDPWRLSIEAAKVGMRATWTAGLLIGVALLVANNATRRRPRRLPYVMLLKLLPLIMATTLGCGIAGGIIGRAGGFVPLSEDFQFLVRDDVFRPYALMAVYGIHLGGYVGGAIGTIVAVAIVWRRRSANAVW